MKARIATAFLLCSLLCSLPGWAAAPKKAAGKTPASSNTELTDEQIAHAKNFYNDSLYIAQAYEDHMKSGRKLTMKDDLDHVLTIASYQYHADKYFKGVTDFVFRNGALPSEIYDLMRSDRFSCAKKPVICKILLELRAIEDDRSWKAYISFVETSGQYINTRYNIPCVTPNQSLDDSEIPYLRALFANHSGIKQNTYALKNRGVLSARLFNEISSGPVDPRLSEAVRTYFKTKDEKP